MGALWNRLDFIAAMEGVVQLHPSAMLNPSALSAPERQLLLEWRNDWVERHNARGSDKAAAKQPERPAKALTLADLAEFNAKEAERAARG